MSTVSYRRFDGTVHHCQQFSYPFAIYCESNNMDTIRSCEQCQRYMPIYYDIRNIDNKLVVRVCKQCLADTDCVISQPHQINNLFLIFYPKPHKYFPIYCGTCGLLDTHSTIYTAHKKTSVCGNCICGNFAKTIERFYDRDRSRELVETLYYRYDITNCQKYFSLVNFAERIKINDERNTLKKYIRLPKELCNIVLSYFWIFEH